MISESGLTKTPFWDFIQVIQIYTIISFKYKVDGTPTLETMRTFLKKSTKIDNLRTIY